MLRNGHRPLLLALALALLFPAPAAAAAPELVSVAHDGADADGDSSVSGDQPMSADGRYVVFVSSATNLVPGDTNDQQDVFVRDRVARTVERVNVSSGGEQALATSYDPAISADGRYVAFVSQASNLVPGDTNAPPPGGGCCWGDVFVHDRETGTTERVSVTSDEQERPGLFPNQPTVSADGRFVAFNSHDGFDPDDGNRSRDVYVRDRLSGTTTWASRPEPGGASTGQGSSEGAIASGGRYVVFSSGDPLLPSDENGWADVYVRDLIEGTLRLESVSSDEEPGDFHSGLGVAISADGRHVAFVTMASNLVPSQGNSYETLVRDTVAGTTERVNLGGRDRVVDSNGGEPMISADGRFVTFGSGAADVVPGYRSQSYVRDRELGRTRMVRGLPDQQYLLGPDGRTIAVGAYPYEVGGTGDYHNVYLTDLAPVPDDTKPPALTLPGDMQVAATSYNGAAVSYDAGVTDDTDADPGLRCRPGSDATFPRGQTTVRCLAADAAGNEREGTFVVDVRDETPPRLRGPQRIELDAGPAGAPVDLSVVEAYDAVDGFVEVSCTPASGSTFPTGTTTVQCSATDAAENVGRTSVEVLVRERATAPAISVSDVRVSEGHYAYVQVTLAEPAAEPYEIRYTTADGTATASDDYSARDDVHTFEVGARHALIDVSFADDRRVEGDEHFTLQVSGGPPGPRDDSGTVTIVDDDAEIVNRRGTLNGPIVFARGRVGFEARPGAISEVPASGGTVETLVREQRGQLSQPAVSPDGRRVLYTAPPPDDGGWQRILKLYDRQTRTTRVVGGLYGDFASPVWQPDGQAYGWVEEPGDCSDCSAYLNVRPYGGRDEYSIRLLGQRVSRLAWSPDGRHVAYDFDDGNSPHGIAVVDIVSAQSTRLTPVNAGYDAAWPSWSPDGSRLAFELRPDAQDADSDIAIIPAGGGEPAVLPDGGEEGMPAWSPDGARIAFSRGEPGSRSIVTTAPDGSGEIVLAGGSYDAVAPDWVPVAQGGDTTKPTIALRTPAEGAQYEVGERVLASYECADETALASCVGTVADAAAIDTATPGAKQFTVTAEDGAGNVSSVTRSYSVVSGSGGGSSAPPAQGSDPPPPPQAGTSTQAPLPPPEAGEKVNALPKSGTVRVRVAGTNRFVELKEGLQIPVGSVIDATKGRVTIVAAGDQSADFYGGVFRLGQTKAAKPLTTLTLVGAISCPKAGRAVAAAKKKKRRLWGNGSGRFRTKGKHSAATVVGTKWLVEDRCGSTLTKVTRGKVRVRDFAKRKNVVVRAGKKYVARARR